LIVVILPVLLELVSHADADLMDVDHLRGAEENLDAILAELDSLGSQS